MEACNYDASANLDDGSCVFADMFYDCNGVPQRCRWRYVCDETIEGCMDPVACDYNADATDGECDYCSCREKARGMASCLRYMPSTMKGLKG